MHRARNNSHLFYNRRDAFPSVDSVARQLGATHLSHDQEHRRNRPVQQFPHNFPFVVATDDMWNDESNSRSSESRFHSDAPNDNWGRNHQQWNKSKVVQGSYRRNSNGYNNEQSSRDGANQRWRGDHGNWQSSQDGANQRWRGDRGSRGSDWRNYNNPSRYFWKHNGGGQGSSRGYSSTRVMEQRVTLPIEEHEREAVAIIREAAYVIREESRWRMIIPHYECLTGAMLRREQIQYDSEEKNDGDRHAVDCHEVIYGYKKDEEAALKERLIVLAKWLLKNPVEHQVDYKADEDAEELQISEESEDENGDAEK